MRSRVVDYKILEAWDPEFEKAQARLQQKVLALVEQDENWEPQGGVGIAWCPAPYEYSQLVQAMVKREEVM